MFRTKTHSFPTDEGQFYLMGIINCTPDSFYDGGKYFSTEEQAIERALQLIEEGAAILDIGGESTRPGSETISVEEELSRVIPVIEEIRKERPDVCLSIDTTKARVAEEALQRGVEIVNDISGLSFDEEMISVVERFEASVVINHIQGNPRTMQKNPSYEDVVSEVREFLLGQAEKCLERGISKERVLLDVGIGFGKTLEHNLSLLRHLKEFCETGYEFLLGTSRKSFIGKIVPSEPKERLSGTIASNVWAYLQGVKFFRVHDVGEHRQAFEVMRRISQAT